MAQQSGAAPQSGAFASPGQDVARSAASTLACQDVADIPARFCLFVTCLALCPQHSGDVQDAV